MRPWKKRGFLYWLFFQDSKKRVTKPRRRALPQHPPKFIEAEAHFEESATVVDNQPEPGVAYPVPSGETVIEAKIAEFIENDFVPEFTGHVQDEEPDGAVPGYGEISAGVEEDTNAPDITVEANPEDIDALHEEEQREDADFLPDAIPDELQNEPVQNESAEQNLAFDYTVTPNYESFDSAASEPDDVNMPLESANDFNQPEEEPEKEIPHLPTCENCNTVFEETDKFCGRCGTKRTRPQVPQVSAYCGGCGAKNEQMMNFCGDCGYKLISTAN